MEGGNLRDADIFGARHQQRQPQQDGTTARSPFQTSRTSYIIIKITVVSPQDVQLWDVKAKQLKSWVDRGLLNVKLLDRTLAYFQNQSSYLQYIRTLKRPVPRIESPGFPGTQWSEFYWKDQTVIYF